MPVYKGQSRQFPLSIDHLPWELSQPMHPNNGRNLSEGGRGWRSFYDPRPRSIWIPLLDYPFSGRALSIGSGPVAPSGSESSNVRNFKRVQRKTLGPSVPFMLTQTTCVSSSIVAALVWCLTARLALPERERGGCLAFRGIWSCSGLTDKGDYSDFM